MHKADIELVKKKLSSVFPNADSISVQADGYGELKVEVISDELKGLSEIDRRKKLDEALGKFKASWRVLVTNEELEDIVRELHQNELPLWPESMARGNRDLSENSLFSFLSDSEDGYERPITTTFYSLRGGVGRSTSLAHTARILARGGARVVCVDMDLEAPGLPSLFGVDDKIKESQGVVKLLLAIDQGESPDVAKHLIPIEEEQNLFLIPAGIPDAAYARDLRFIDPGSWYEEDENPLRMLMDKIRSDLPFSPDFILIDSRTGISSISAPLLFEQADIAVVVFFPHQQAYKGTEALFNGLLGARNWRRKEVNGRMCGPDVRFLVGPVPTGNAEVSKRLRNRSLEWVSSWFSPIQEVRREAGLLEVDEADVSHWIPYREEIATSKSVFEIKEINSLYQPVADWITGIPEAVDKESVSEVPSPQKISILQDLRVEDGAAENQAKLEDIFIETDVVKEALNDENPLVLGRKGTGKTALYMRMRGGRDQGRKVVSILSPSNEDDPLALGSQMFRFISEELISSGYMGWSEIWMFYILLFAERQSISSGEHVTSLLNLDRIPEKASELFKAMEEAVRRTSSSKFSLLLQEEFYQFGHALKDKVVFIWDGLDTQFGHSDAGREIRKEALASLLSFVLEWESAFEGVFFKVLLREDIWRQISFDNKSHLYGRSVFLKWADQYVFLKVVLKQIWRSEKLQNFILQRMGMAGLRQPTIDVEKWDDAIVVDVWNIICGVRMSGGKTAFTRNWVWTRLGDANDDHAPRHLLQLFNAAIRGEIEQERKSPYGRSLIRPNTLVRVLPDVSNLALDALINEEFKELDGLRDRLRGIARTPFPAKELNGIDSGLINLAMEVGLLGIHEGTDTDIERYRVPEIYRLGLGMTRRGQA